MTGTMLATTTPPSIITSYLLANLPPRSLAIKQTSTQQTNKQINQTDKQTKNQRQQHPFQIHCSEISARLVVAKLPIPSLTKFRQRVFSKLWSLL